MDFVRARDFMVESQVRPSDVTDPRIIHAMWTLPRERFMPAHKRALAYADIEVDVAQGRSLMRPRDLAKLIQSLAPQPGAVRLESLLFAVPRQGLDTPGFEHFDFERSNAGAFEPADQFFRFSGEHAAANDFDPARTPAFYIRFKKHFDNDCVELMICWGWKDIFF